MKYTLEFEPVNEYLKERGLRPFPFHSIVLNAEPKILEEDVKRYNNLLLDWQTEQERCKK